MGGRGGARGGGGGGGGGATKRPEVTTGLAGDVPKQRPDGAWVTKNPAAGSIPEKKGFKVGEKVYGRYQGAISQQKGTTSGRIAGFTRDDVLVREPSRWVWIDAKNVFRMGGKK